MSGSNNFVQPFKGIVLPAVLEGTNTPKPLTVDASGGLKVSGEEDTGLHTTLNITGTTLIFTGTGELEVMSIVAGGTVGTIYDSGTTVGTAAEVVGLIGTTTGFVQVNFPVSNGLLVECGNAQTISLSYSLT